MPCWRENLVFFLSENIQNNPSGWEVEKLNVLNGFVQSL